MNLLQMLPSKASLAVCEKKKKNGQRKIEKTNEILVGVAFFNETVPVEVEVAMVASLDKQGENLVP